MSVIIISALLFIVGWIFIGFAIGTHRSMTTDYIVYPTDPVGITTILLGPLALFYSWEDALDGGNAGA